MERMIVCDIIMRVKELQALDAYEKHIADIDYNLQRLQAIKRWDMDDYEEVFIYLRMQDKAIADEELRINGKFLTSCNYTRTYLQTI